MFHVVCLITHMLTNPMKASFLVSLKLSFVIGSPTQLVELGIAYSITVLKHVYLVLIFLYKEFLFRCNLLLIWATDNTKHAIESLAKLIEVMHVGVVQVSML